MITASLVTYKTRLKDITTIIDCIKDSIIDKLYVIDNSSDDSIRDCLKDKKRIEYIPNVNNGYGAGHNIGFNRAIEDESKYHVVINPDIVFVGRVIEDLKYFMDSHPDVGLVMPKVLYPDGEIQHLCKLLPTPSDLILRRFIPEKFGRKSRERFELRFSGYDKEMEVPYLSGCFMFLRTSVLKDIGGFDERYFMYGEDIDLSRRINKKYKTVYFPEVSIIHAHEKASYKSKKMLLVHIQNLIRYFNKWGWFFDKDRKRVNQQTLHQIEQINNLIN